MGEIQLKEEPEKNLSGFKNLTGFAVKIMILKWTDFLDLDQRTINQMVPPFPLSNYSINVSSSSTLTEALAMAVSQAP